MIILTIIGAVLLIFIIRAIGYVQIYNILVKRDLKDEITQNLCKKYNPHVVRGKNGRFKSVLSPHIKKV